MFPLPQRIIDKGRSFGVMVKYPGRAPSHHLGVDYHADGDILRAPFNGTITRRWRGIEGGNTLWFVPDHDSGKIIRFLHLDHFKLMDRLVPYHVDRGEEIAVTDSTGWCDWPHCHVDIYAGSSVDPNHFENFRDPEAYDWSYGDNVTPQPVISEPFWIKCSVRTLYVRNAPNLGGQKIEEKTLHYGDRVQCISTVTGENISGNDQWYLSKISVDQGTPRYFWSGGTVKI